MAIRRPLYYNSAGAIKEWSDADITELKNYWVNLWINGTIDSCTLRGLNQGGSHLDNLTDTRLQAGAYRTSVSSTPSEATTPEPSVVTVNWSKILKQYDAPSLSYSNESFPLYYTGSGQLRNMSYQDFKDTFVYPVIDIIIAAQPYRITNGSSLSGYTQVTHAYQNTIANVGAYTAAGIAETLDQPTTLTNYYLHKRNSYGSYTPKNALVNYNNGIREIDVKSDATMQLAIRSSAVLEPGRRIRFYWNSTGNSLGSVSDTRLNGSGNYQTRFVNGDDYRAQEFPNGSQYTVNTWTLRIRKE